MKERILRQYSVASKVVLFLAKGNLQQLDNMTIVEKQKISLKWQF